MDIWIMYHVDLNIDERTFIFSSDVPIPFT